MKHLLEKHCIKKCSLWIWNVLSNSNISKIANVFKVRSAIFCLDKCSPKISSVLLAMLMCYGRFLTHDNRTSFKLFEFLHTFKKIIKLEIYRKCVTSYYPKSPKSLLTFWSSSMGTIKRKWICALSKNSYFL